MLAPREGVLTTRVNIFALALYLGMTIGQSAFANPQGPAVVHGAADFARPNANTLNVTNTPGAIINWQGFSIRANEVTRFIQNSASS
ncbi:MAG: hypothetical protein ACI8PT_001663, partial [Gammaproteobacteria bacterium]